MSEPITVATLDLTIPENEQYSGTVEGNDISYEKFGSTVSNGRLYVDVKIPVVDTDIVYEDIGIVTGSMHDVSVMLGIVQYKEDVNKYRIGTQISWIPRTNAGVISFVMKIRGVAYNVVVSYNGPE